MCTGSGLQSWHRQRIRTLDRYIDSQIHQYIYIYIYIHTYIHAERTFVLIPEELYNDQSYQLDSRYEGNQYIGEIEEIKYGLTKVVTVGAIKKSIYDYAVEIRDKGYDVPRRFAWDENN